MRAFLSLFLPLLISSLHAEKIITNPNWVARNTSVVTVDSILLRDTVSRMYITLKQLPHTSLTIHDDWVVQDSMKRFSVKDGWGVIFLRELDIPVAIMTGENTQIVQKRADKLKIDYCYLGVKDKVAQAEELCRELGISLGEVAFIGDDLNDLPLLRLVGYSASPSNTPEYVKREVKYVTAAHGGYGAFREFVEKLLSDNGVLEKTVGKFL
mgnify:CR=1 FL=1